MPAFLPTQCILNLLNEIEHSDECYMTQNTCDKANSLPKVKKMCRIYNDLHILPRMEYSSKHRVIDRINISLRTFTTVMIPCYYDSPSPDQFRYETDLSN